MIEFSVICDECGRIIDASRQSPAAVRRIARAQKLLFKHKGRELCRECFEDATK